MHTYIYAHAHSQRHICVCICMYVHMFVCPCIYVCVCITLGPIETIQDKNLKVTFRLQQLLRFDVSFFLYKKHRSRTKDMKHELT